MEVTGQLKAPDLGPCPGRDDLDKCVDDSCQPCPEQKTVNWEGYDCCNYWNETPNVWCNDVVRTDQINPEKFKYDSYRYQLFAKPQLFDCHAGEAVSREGGQSLHEPGRCYVQPSTDIRALQQTTYIPVLPTKPGGERDVTFPMTARTLGQPDVTSACCVPVLPCQPGFKNLTPNIKPTSAEICQTGNYCEPHGRLFHNPCQQGGALQCAPPHSGGVGGGMGPPPQYITPPSNVAGAGWPGMPDTFPAIQQRQCLPGSASNHSPNHIPQYDGAFPSQCQQNFDQMCLNDMDDGTANYGGKCMNAKTFRYQDRVGRAIASKLETPEQFNQRMHTMYGAYGSAMMPRPMLRRRSIPQTKDNITQQGNGFSWSYPKNENRQCYVLERNPRC